MSQNEPNNDSLIGLSIDHGRYQIVKLIGEGGMGRVFQARQTSMNRMVALKILRRQLAGDTQLLDRFEREAMSVSRLRHPNTITIYDYGRTEDGFLFMAMELLGGRSLYSLLRDVGPLNLPRALHIFEHVCGAVSEAHDLGIVHRDLKPENIQIDEVANDPDYAKVLDFGIAKIVHGDQDAAAEQKTLTLAGAVFGTPHYMSPEQVHGLKIDHRTDIYSLGIILFEMLAGRPPFDGATPMAVMMAQANQPTPNLRQVNPEADATPGVIQLINECMAKDPEDRPPTVHAVVQRIQQVQYELGEISSVRLPASALGLGDGAGVRGAGLADRATPLPDVSGASDAGPTPDYVGHMNTLAPNSLETDLLPPRRTGLWAAIIALLIVGGGVAVWQLTGSTPPPAAASQPPARITLETDNARGYQITSSPSKALVFLGETSQGLTPLELRLDPSKGYRVTVRLPGYTPVDVDFEPNAAEADRARHVKLERVVGKPRDRVLLTSTPPGAEIYRGANLVGITPFEWRPEVTAFPVELRFSLAGYQEHSQAVRLEVNEGDARPVEITLVKPVAAVEPPKPQPKPPVRRPVRRPATRANRPAARPKTPATQAAPVTEATPATQAPRYEKL